MQTAGEVRVHPFWRFEAWSSARVDLRTGSGELGWPAVEIECGSWLSTRFTQQPDDHMPWGLDMPWGLAEQGGMRKDICFDGLRMSWACLDHSLEVAGENWLARHIQTVRSARERVGELLGTTYVLACPDRPGNLGLPAPKRHTDHVGTALGLEGQGRPRVRGKDGQAVGDTGE